MFGSKDKESSPGPKNKVKLKGVGFLNFGNHFLGSNDLKQIQGLVTHLCELERRWRAQEEVTNEIIQAHDSYEMVISYILDNT